MCNECNSLIDQLKHELDKRKQKNRYYSLRSFSRDIGISPSYLSKILSEKAKVTEKLKIRVTASLNLTIKEDL